MKCLYFVKDLNNKLHGLIVFFQIVVLVTVLFQLKDSIPYYDKLSFENSGLAEDSLQNHLLRSEKRLTLKLERDGSRLQTSTQQYNSEIDLKQSAKPSLANSFYTEKYKNQNILMKNRLSNIRNKCLGLINDKYWQNLKQGGRVWTYKPLDLHYCMVPKVGCTFWKKIMRFLAQDYPLNQNIERPSDINRIFVHYGGLKNLTENRVDNPIARMMMMSGKAFMFSRDPYSRLWSAYIDKFLLPDFWRTDARAIMKRLRPNFNETDKNTCANNVTFQEFLMFINFTSKFGLNEHWDKIHRICSPCHVNYDVIGTQETFSDDADFILTKFGLDYLKENTTKLDMVREEITSLTNYNFDLEPYIQKICFDKVDIASRLWLAFQYNGYIHRNVSFPESMFKTKDFLKEPIPIFLNVVFETIERQKDLGYALKSQKRTMMLEAYRSIPRDLITDIAKVYEYDFELFGYERNIV